MRILSILLLLLPTLGPARADDGPPAGTLLEMSRAAACASPGAPAALDAFLPAGRRPRPLAWPLPAGDLIVLGLPAQDPAARRLADVFHLDVEDLGGGYRLWAWQAEARKVVLVMGGDPAALHAARFEFDAQAPMAGSAPDMRSLDFRRPAEEAALVVRAGTRSVRPRWRTRAWWPGEAAGPATVATAAGARASHVWIEAPIERTQALACRERIQRLRAQGVEPVLVTRVEGQLNEASVALLEAHIGRDLVRWQQAHALRDFALVFDATGPSARGVGVRAVRHEARLVRAMAAALRAGGLETLTVVPRGFSDRRAQAGTPPPDLRDVPEAVIAWSGPLDRSVCITRAQAERRAREVGVPLVLLETWSADAGASVVPTVTRGREAGLEEVLEGIVVLGGHAVAAILGSAWAPEEPRFGLAELGRFVPATPQAPGTFLQALRAALEAADREALGLVPWMGPLRRELAQTAAAMARAPDGVTLPVVPAGAVTDGHVDEPSWAYARAFGHDGPGVQILAFSDGSALHLAVRVRAPVGTADPFPVRLSLEAVGRVGRFDVRVERDGVTVEGVDEYSVPEPGHVRAAWTQTAERHAAEIVFDRFALGGDAHAGRRFDLRMVSRTRSLWPSKATPDTDPGVAIVTR